jgi:glycosyltransferase involved in cell wall biosynthesis
LMPVRVTQAKNIEYAFQVVASLTRMGVLPKLVITGPPDPHDPDDMRYFDSLLSLRSELGLQKEARFVYESGPQGTSGYTIGLPVVREIYRLCDALFMPSHREGFGMPILEAGLVGMPVFTTPIPAAEEIGSSEVTYISGSDPAETTARLILESMASNKLYELRKRVRQKFTWQAIFQHDILPLLKEAGIN